VRTSYRLHRLVARSGTSRYSAAVRGVQLGKNSGPPVAANGSLYDLLQKTRGHRRILLSAMLKLFEDDAVRR